MDFLPSIDTQDKKFYLGYNNSASNPVYCAVDNNSNGSYENIYWYDDKQDIIANATDIDSDGIFDEFKSTTDAIADYPAIDVDGKIEQSYQEGSGDCWILGTLNSLSYTQDGKKIINDTLEYTETGAILHTHFGDYPISTQEILVAQRTKIKDEDGEFHLKYASGDDDILPFEIGIEKLRADILSGKINISSDNFSSYSNKIVKDPKNLLSSGFSGELIYYLTGDRPFISNSKIINSAVLNEIYKNPQNHTMLQVGFNDDIDINSIDGNKIHFVKNHAYALKNVNKDTVTLVNPYNSDLELEINKEDFLNNCKDLTYYDYDKNSNFINGGVDFLNKVLRNVGYFISSIAQN